MSSGVSPPSPGCGRPTCRQRRRCRRRSRHGRTRAGRYGCSRFPSLGILPVGQRSDDPLAAAHSLRPPSASGWARRCAGRAAYRREARPARSGRLRDGLYYSIEVIDEFEMVAGDLVRPDSGKQHDLSAIRVGDRCSKRVVARHSRGACRTARTTATMPGYHRGRPPRNKGEQYPADPPTERNDRPPTGRRAPRASANTRSTRYTTRSLAGLPHHPHIQHANLGITSVYLEGIDSSEIVSTVHGRPSPTISANAGLQLRR